MTFWKIAGPVNPERSSWLEMKRARSSINSPAIEGRGMLKSRGGPNWSRSLPRALAIPTVMTLETLADVRELIEKHLPRELRAKPSWRYLAVRLKEAARGADAANVAAALVIALALEGVKCRPRK
jgi:hypothetical protein